MPSARFDRPSGRRRYRCGRACGQAGARTRSPAPRPAAARARTTTPPARVTAHVGRLPFTHVLKQRSGCLETTGSSSVQQRPARRSAAPTLRESGRRFFTGVRMVRAHGDPLVFTDIVDRGPPAAAVLPGGVHPDFFRHRISCASSASPQRRSPRQVVAAAHVHTAECTSTRDVRGGVGDDLRADLGDLSVNGQQAEFTLAAISFGIGAALVLDEYR